MLKKRSTKFYFKREKEIMNRLGLKGTYASGSGWLEKEDGTNEFILAQLKSTDANSINIKMDDIIKLDYHSLVEHKTPLFIIDFIKQDKLYIMLDINNLEAIYNNIICNKTLEDPEADEFVDVTDISSVETQTVLVTSGDKKAYWEEREKERINKMKGVKK